MKTIYFNCTLLSDVVLNSKLATEGNMTTLDFIPGSNFLGIVAKHLYGKVTNVEAFQIFHSDEVRFSDARIATSQGEITYAVPFTFFQQKEKSKLEQDHIYLHHLITKENHPKDDKETPLQLQQSRTGYISAKGTLVKEIQKKFSLKSAYDRDSRTSKTGNMFGFEALPAGTSFIFSVESKNESLLELVTKALKGTQRLGKSKTAEFGQVQIELFDIKEEIKSFDSNGKFVLVYAESNLCFFNENGQPTFQPTVKDLGLEDGEIDWSKSQVRTYSYAPWNGQRKTTSTQRHCILKGSVFYIKGPKSSESSKYIGNYQAEGLGKVIYNPEFLKGKENSIEAELKVSLDKSDSTGFKKGTLKTPLSNFLHNKYLASKVELMTSQEVQKYVHQEVPTTYSKLKDVSASQWGTIRSIASRAKDNKEIKDKLYDGKDAYLSHGVAFEKCWGENGSKRLNQFKAIIAEIENPKNPKEGDLKADLRIFIAKFASEMAKKFKKQ
ncbi:hypothetical protein SAMN03080617_01511 [Algoriphagus alkaliphilus]|uniref:CRISPR-associated protein Csx10 n=1 Tax=Algoriphagus alkaliphilus TaxID=279824 RepID=A0A1G5X229_9BACT|nr:hypothetical protein [Algoriphagus alkaliphilus]SDA64322.1 hypothetical protein SAMN03080617_01511 [Algoriphagus alkaliphilus]